MGAALFANAQNQGAQDREVTDRIDNRSVGSSTRRRLRAVTETTIRHLRRTAFPFMINTLTLTLTLTLILTLTLTLPLTLPLPVPLTRSEC